MLRTVRELGPISVRDLTATALAGKQRRVGAAAAEEGGKEVNPNPSMLG